jgi:hypothetical protein
MTPLVNVLGGRSALRPCSALPLLSFFGSLSCSPADTGTDTPMASIAIRNKRRLVERLARVINVIVYLKKTINSFVVTARTLPSSIREPIYG